MALKSRFGFINNFSKIYSINESKDRIYELEIAGVNQINNTKNIEFLGKVSARELSHLIQKAKFVVVPSKWHENNSLSILESLSLGTPVISSDYGGSPEMVINYKTGFIFSFDKENSLTKTIETSANISNLEYDEISANSKDFYRSKYSKEIHLNKLVDLYNQLNS